MDPETQRVRAFYEKYSFPGYDGYESVTTLIDKSRRGIYANLLNEQIRFHARVLDVGCGTGQLVNFLSLGGRYVVGCDLSFNSLSKAMGFQKEFALEHASFVQADVFEMPFREQSFDYVLCNGVLHHTKDPYKAFESICPLVKTGGLIVVGLYNRFARTALNIRKSLLRSMRRLRIPVDRVVLRRGDADGSKEAIWFMDQYEHPKESTHTIDEVLNWFRRNGISYLNSIPKITYHEELAPRENLFAPHRPGGRMQHILRQLSWVVTQAREGGFFILIGRKSG